MEIKYRDGLLFTSIDINYRGKHKRIDNIIIDTGAAHSIIDVDHVFDLDIAFESEDRLITMYGIGGEEHAFAKIIDTVIVGTCTIENYDMHFGIIDPKGNVKGLLGLDLLIKAGVTIDLKNIRIYQ